MTIGKWPLTAIAAMGLLGLGLSEAEEDPVAQLTRPTKIELDFKNRPISEIVQAIAERSGKRVSVQRGVMTKDLAFRVDPGIAGNADWQTHPVTLESPAPVPFWEGIDRLAETGRLAYLQRETSDPGEKLVSLSFEGAGDPPSPASYAGPFRVGLLGVHSYNEQLFVQGPWVRFYPSAVAVAGTAADLSAAPKDGGPRYVELDVAVEPGLIAHRNGPLKAVEAVDESDRSLLAPAKEDQRQWFQAFAFLGGGIAPVLRIPLSPFEHDKGGRSHAIRRLSGVIPVELAALKPKPALAIPLGSAEGKTFEGGGAVIKVETARTGPDGRMKLAFTCRLSGEDSEPFRRSARLALLRSFQLSLLDARGEVAASSSSSSGGDSLGNLTFSYEYVPSSQPENARRGPPSELRYYDFESVPWQIPFEFHDIPLP